MNVSFSVHSIEGGNKGGWNAGEKKLVEKKNEALALLINFDDACDRNEKCRIEKVLTLR
jgi:hypothetical protein